jgi:hypothetical protein
LRALQVQIAKLTRKNCLIIQGRRDLQVKDIVKAGGDFLQQEIFDVQFLEACGAANLDRVSIIAHVQVMKL